MIIFIDPINLTKLLSSFKVSSLTERAGFSKLISLMSLLENIYLKTHLISLQKLRLVS